jgi:hypothetical protein
MKAADRRWRYVGVISSVLGAAVIFIGAFSVESGGTNAFVGVPAPALGGALLGLGIGLWMMQRKAERDAGDPPSSA